MADVVHLESAVVVAGGYPTLSGVDLTIEGPAICVVTGPNGAGKTSLLRLLGGLSELASGRGSVLGHNLTGDRRQLRRRVGWLGHEGSFYDDLTVQDNLAFAAAALKRPVGDIDSALERVALTTRRGTLARRLSAGQRRRLGLAWLLLRRPSLWLLDEPYASIDDAGRTFLDGLLLDVVASGSAVVVTAHDPLRDERIAARAIAMAGGRIVADGR